MQPNTAGVILYQNNRVSLVEINQNFDRSNQNLNNTSFWPLLMCNSFSCNKFRTRVYLILLEAGELHFYHQGEL